MPKNTERFTKEPFPKIRRATIGVLRAAKRKNMIHSFLELDISMARETLRRMKRERKGYISFLGYIIYCVSRAVDENKIMHAYKNTKNQLILFDDVDVSTTIERQLNNRKEVVAKIIRGANNKSLTEISMEIERERSGKINDAEVFRSMKLFISLPGFLHQIVFAILDKFPLLMKKRAGTVMVTSANMVGKGAAWGLPIATHTLNITLGGIVERIIEKNGRFEKTEHLCLTLSFDHDIIDGAPAARFVRKLKNIISDCEPVNI